MRSKALGLISPAQLYGGVKTLILNNGAEVLKIYFGEMEKDFNNVENYSNILLRLKEVEKPLNGNGQRRKSGASDKMTNQYYFRPDF